MKLIRNRRRVSSAAAAVLESLESRRLFSVVLNSAVSIPISAVPTGNPAGPVVANFDGDTTPDVVVAFPAPTAIEPGYIQFGKGDGSGTFTMSTEVNVGIFTSRPVVGDFNGDGKQDLAVTNAFGGQVLVLAGNGDGTFAAAQPFTAGVSPESLAVGDFNADMRSDLVVGNRSDNTAQVFLGDATTTLGAPITLNTAGDPASVAIGDFNGDTFADVLVGAAGSAGAPTPGLQVFPGNGDGTFITTPINTPGPLGVGVASDLNRDGTVDVVTGVSARDRADVFLNNSDGTFHPTKGSTGTSGVNLPVAADMNEDTHPDLVTAVAGRIDVLVGNGDGTFAKAVTFDAAGGSAPAAADVTGDGRLDVLTISAAEGVQAGRTLNVSVAQRVGPDFSIAFATVPPPNILLGSVQRISVTVTNHGNETYKGQVPIQILSSDDTIPDENDSILLQTFPKVKLGIGQSKTLKLKVEFAGSPGTFNLLARVDPFGTGGDLNTFDNTAIASGQFSAAEPFVNLAVTPPIAPTVPLKAGDKVRIDFTVANTGNITASGKTEFDLLASTDNAPDQFDEALQVFLKKIKIAPNTLKTFTFKFRLPAIPATNYFVIGLVNNNGGVSEADASDNVGVSTGQFTVIA